MKRQRLREERIKKKLNQQQAAEQIGISAVYVRKLESGVVKPGRDTMLKIESFYGVSAKKLFPDIFLSFNDKKLIKTGTE
jgi:putative transcriptional regulator